jgi:uncharacterized Ntn-hydrolase superfamily protein
MRHGTYSIVARDPETGELGVAVHSHWFSVGQIVPSAEPGVGAIANQSVPDPSFGSRALELLRGGAGATEALRRVLEGDEGLAFRQLAIVDAIGEVAVHTGDGCIPNAAHAIGDGFSAQANMMAAETVPAAMADAFRSAPGPLAERLLAALVAAEGEGGDLRGRQSAALRVAGAIDLRIEDHPDPVTELTRLLTLQRAYDLADRADQLAAEGSHDDAAALYQRAAELAPASDELLFWAGLGIAQAGDVDTGVTRVREAIERGGERWRVLLERLSPEIAPSAAAVRDAL